MQSDKELISNYFKGDEQSFAVLVGRYLDIVYKFTFRYLGNAGDAEDVTQEVFVKAWRHIKKFDPEKNFLTWLLAIAKNTAIDVLRKKKPMSFVDFEDENGLGLAEIVPDIADLPEDVFEKKELKIKVEAALAKLPPHYRMVIYLHYADHLNLSEIAESLGESVNTIKSRYRRGLLMLKKNMIQKS